MIIIPVTDSPLRYPGGKTQMKKFVVDILKENTIHENYVEPFAGGSGVALFLLFNNYVNRIYINDLDPCIYSFWNSVLNQTTEFIKLIEETPVTLKEWHYQRTIQKNPDRFTELEIGFATFFLNRTNVSGIITGGPLGGKNQQSNYKIDCRFNKVNLIKKIKRIASFKEMIELTNHDAEDFISNEICKLNPENTLIFFDPPYYKQGKNLYSNFYDHDDHVSLSEKIKSLTDYFWITTYDSSEEIEKIYSGISQKEYSLNYSANNIRKATELLFYSDRIALPDSENIYYIEKV
ncbi:DNA adenine methylase [Aquibacillus rhizosphaerae]|uniref:site-specific DNA-methyltransferase (adenine-specific) n=1 Tax=Aquibacillus rhizosphaerae TaxID=3051431 RepID=A0ABT7LAB7_9BACI|nr:DNA adenine methylase [Aquibacillus sp. LR5S19]MDL4842792.1 DNA adenine methylase [Aquibacillus sp. LR5S19]